MADAIRLGSVAVNCTDAPSLAAFHADITGGRIDFQPNADHRLVFADPAGHPFCLTTWDDVPA